MRRLLIALFAAWPSAAFAQLASGNYGLVSGGGLSGTASGDLSLGAYCLDIGLAGVKFCGDGDGAVTLLGTGNGSDEDLTLNLDDTSNVAVWSSSTGVTAWTLPFAINLGTAGVKISDDGDGAITFLSLGNGSGGLEDLTLNLDDTSNVGTFSSSTGLATLAFTSIALSATTVTASTGLVGGGITGGYVLISNADSPYTVPATVEFIECNATAGVVTVTTGAAASTLTGRHVEIKKTDASANSCTFDPNGAETVDGAATKTNTTQYQAFSFSSNSSNWLIW